MSSKDCFFAQTNQPRILMNQTGYPIVIELDRNQPYKISVHSKSRSYERTVTVLSVRSYFEPNLWFTTGEKNNYCRAEVDVDISGKKYTLILRPYQMPVTCNGLRIFVETIKDWAYSSEVSDMNDVQKEARLSICAAGQSWGPDNFIFPLEKYRWKANAYQNTWGALVPYNIRYYHRGEDYGAIPDLINIKAPFAGKVITSPLPDGDGKSNAVFIENNEGVICRISHMNIDNVFSNCNKGNSVKAGEILAKTGMTWNGRKTQVNDPHCHIELQYNGTLLASYPYLMEAYLRNYSDRVVAVAGGYQFTVTNNKIVLDGSRSLERRKGDIVSYQWKLHNDSIVKEKKFTIQYTKPGVYTEELKVTAKDGAIDRDFVQVRVYDTTNARNLAYGWAYYFPIREIKPGISVLFWNRLVNVQSPVVIDFGDKSPAVNIGKQIYHVYKKAGRYVVSLNSMGEGNEPVTIKMEVVVD